MKSTEIRQIMENLKKKTEGKKIINHDQSKQNF